MAARAATCRFWTWTSACSNWPGRSTSFSVLMVDQKEFPENVDVALVEGAVSSDEDLEKIRKVRARSRLLVSLGDCAVTANIPSMRNPFKVQDVLRPGLCGERYAQSGSAHAERFPPCCRRPGRFTNLSTWTCTCRAALPPPTPSYLVLTDILEGRCPDLSAKTRFGA